MKKKTIEKPLKWAELLSRPYYTQADKEYYLQFIGRKIHSISLLPPQTVKIVFSGDLYSFEMHCTVQPTCNQLVSFPPDYKFG